MSDPFLNYCPSKVNNVLNLTKRKENELSPYVNNT